MTLCVDCGAQVHIVDQAPVMECDCSGYTRWLTQDQIDRLKWIEKRPALKARAVAA